MSQPSIEIYSYESPTQGKRWAWELRSGHGIVLAYYEGYVTRDLAADGAQYLVDTVRALEDIRR